MRRMTDIAQKYPLYISFTAKYYSYMVYFTRETLYSFHTGLLDVSAKYKKSRVSPAFLGLKQLCYSSQSTRD